MRVSDTAIPMTYSLVEGFFFEEYRFYFSSEPQRGKKLEATIGELLKYIGIFNNYLIEKGVSKITGLRAPRHAIAHRNGAPKQTEIAELQEHFSSDVDTSRGYPVASVRFAIEAIQVAETLVSRYGKAALDSAERAQQSVPPDAPCRREASSGSRVK